jgi:hypothetical protein
MTAVFKVCFLNASVKRQVLFFIPITCVTLIFTLTPREEQRLRVSENRVLRRIFGTKMEVVMGGWRSLHNEELHKLYTHQILLV